MSVLLNDKTQKEDVNWVKKRLERIPCSVDNGSIKWRSNSHVIFFLLTVDEEAGQASQGGPPG